jgi:Uma2 family endonuclease
MVEKLRLYERHGVLEYWVVDPGNRYIHVYVRDAAGRYPDPALYVGAATVPSTVYPAFELRLEDLFAALPS